MTIKRFFLLSISLLLSQNTLANEEAPTRIFTNIAQAEAQIAQVEKELGRLEDQYNIAQYECYRRFFVTPCLEEAKTVFLEKKRVQETLKREANWYLREQDKLIKDARVQDKQLKAQQETIKATDRVNTRLIKEQELQQRLAALPTPTEIAEREKAYQAKQQSIAEAKLTHADKKAESERKRQERIKRRQAAMEEARQEQLKQQK